MKFQLRHLNSVLKGCDLSNEIYSIHRNGHGIPWPNCPPLGASVSRNSIRSCCRTNRSGYQTWVRNKKQACTRSSVSHMVLEPGRNSVMGGSDGITLMLGAGWKPESNQDWCGMSALIFRSNRTLPLEQLVASLPENIDRRTATGWLVAAIEEDAHYRYNRKSR